jgi:hypothetical protein
MSASFDINTGTVNVDGETRFVNDAVDSNYIQFVGKGSGKSSDPNYPKSYSSINIRWQITDAPGQAPAQLIAVARPETGGVPMISLVTFENNSLKTLFYVGVDGNTKILFSNNRKNAMKFVPGGIVFGAPPEVYATPEHNATGVGPGQASGGGNLLSICCCSSMCMIGCGVLLTLAFKK